jgi:hypothetical protein
MPSTVDYTAALDIQHYIVPLRMASVVLEDAATAAANNGAALSSWLNTANAISGTGNVNTSGTGTSFQLQVNGVTRTVTNAALVSNVVTLTLSAAAGAGAAVGSSITVASLPSPFTVLNGTFTITAVTTVSPFTVSYALTNTNITSAAVAAGTVTSGGSYSLDGTGAPIQLLNVTGAPISTQTGDEKVLTHDQVVRGASISVGTSTDSSIALKGMTVHKSIDHKIMEVMRQFGVAEKLAVKYLRVGPGGIAEKKLCYGRISSKNEEGDAGALVKYGASLNVLGSIYNIFDNT